MIFLFLLLMFGCYKSSLFKRSDKNAEYLSQEWKDTIKSGDPEKVIEFLDREAESGSIGKEFIYREGQNANLTYPFLLYVQFPKDVDDWEIKRDRVVEHIIVRYMTDEAKSRGQYIDPNKNCGIYLASLITIYSKANLLETFILNAKPDLTVGANSSLSPLILAAHPFDKRKMDILLDHGAIFNLESKGGYLAAFALWIDNIELVKYLWNRGVDFNGKLVNGLYPSDYAAIKGNPRLMQFCLLTSVKRHTLRDIRILFAKRALTLGLLKSGFSALEQVAGPFEWVVSTFSDLVIESVTDFLKFSASEEQMKDAAHAFERTIREGEWALDIDVKNPNSKANMQLAVRKIRDRIGRLNDRLTKMKFKSQLNIIKGELKRGELTRAKNIYKILISDIKREEEQNSERVEVKECGSTTIQAFAGGFRANSSCPISEALELARNWQGKHTIPSVDKLCDMFKRGKLPKCGDIPYLSSERRGYFDDVVVVLDVDSYKLYPSDSDYLVKLLLIQN